jgi:hypothetical protein
VREAVEKRAKSMKPFGFTNEANHGRNKKQKETRKQRRHANLSSQICVSPAQKKAKQHITGATPKKPHKSMVIASDTMR